MQKLRPTRFAKVLIIRAGDFFRDWYRPRKIRNPGQRGVGHRRSFLPDATEKWRRCSTSRPLRIFHIDSRWDQGGRHMIEAIIFLAQHHLGGAIDTRERLMRRRMIMTIQIDAIAPVRAPASGDVDGSDHFDRATSIARRIQRSSSSVIHTSGGSTSWSGTCADPRRRALTAA